MALRIAVCDDENNWINELEKCLLRYNENNNRIDWEVFYSGEELLKYCAAHGSVSHRESFGGRYLAYIKNKR